MIVIALMGKSQFRNNNWVNRFLSCFTKNIFFYHVLSAFVSWVRFYSTFPRELRPIFNIKTAHMGHHAKSLALREAPTAFAKQHYEPRPELPRNRLTIEERRPPARTTPFQLKMEPKSLVMAIGKRGGTKVVGGKRLPARRNDRKYAEKYGYEFQRGLKTAKMLTVSEFDSGLPPLKKRKMK